MQEFSHQNVTQEIYTLSRDANQNFHSSYFASNPLAIGGVAQTAGADSWVCVLKVQIAGCVF